MEPDEDHRSANPCDVEFDIIIFNITIHVTAEIMETDEGAEVESLMLELYDLGLEEFVDITAECKEKFSPKFLSDIDDKALAEWEKALAEWEKQK